MGSIVHRSVPTNLKWFPTCSHAHAMFQDRFKDVQVGSRWFSTLYILSPNFHKKTRMSQEAAILRPMAGSHSCHILRRSLPGRGSICTSYSIQRNKSIVVRPC